VSRESVEVVRRALELLRESYERGAATDALLSLCAPDMRVDATRRVFNPDVYEGRAGVERSIRDTCDALEEFSETNERLIDAGERVVVTQTISGRGRVSRARVEQRGALIWTVRDGLVQLIEVFIDQDEALREVGERANALADLGLAAAGDEASVPRSNRELVLNVFLPDGHTDRSAFYALLDLEVVWDMSRSRFPDTGVYRAIDGVRQWFDGLAKAFGEVTYEVKRVREGGDRVAIEIHLRGRGPGSGIPVDYSFVPVLSFRAGKVVRMERYDAWPEAIAAMGLAD
jgi:ketosteroid isomerase-like protein